LSLGSRLKRVSALFSKRQGADLYLPTEARSGVGDDEQYGYDGAEDEFGFLEAPIDLAALQMMLANLPAEGG
jgi:hypothetical protein